MRIAAIAALVLLAAACSSPTDHTAHQNPAPTPSSTAAAPTTTAAKPAPGTGAALGEVSGWVDAGSRADGSAYASASTDDGVTSDLDAGDRAFSSPTGKIKCMSDGHEGRHALVCLVDLKNPPERPADKQGNWVGGWVEYEGQTLTVGGLHGDPGPFIRGYGDELPYGSQITVHGTKCRMDSAGLYCVNSQAGTGFRANDAGIVTFGCLSEEAVPRTVNAGEYHTC
ncbi:hypothetical protein ACWEKT_11585 [Nocardia takedensis]|uniref:hypothetical protein n=1 Tax=Nocardia takedensis TaxID=259390 RepID=UPI00030947D7|nr:hypothetical protein [Nocardia takedensis]